MRLTTGCPPAAGGQHASTGGASVVNMVSMAAFRAIPIVPGYGVGQGGAGRPHRQPGQALGRTGHPGQRRGPRRHRHPDDRADGRLPRTARRRAGPHPHGPPRDPRRDRRRRAVPGQLGRGATSPATRSSSTAATCSLSRSQPLAPHYHVGIVVPDLAAAQAQLRRQLGVTWGPVLHLDATESATAPGRTSSCPPRFCYSVEAPHLELIEEVPGSVWVCNEHSNLHHIGFWSDDLPAEQRPPGRASGARCSSAAGPGTTPRVLRLPPQRARASASRSSAAAMREAMSFLFLPDET